MRGYSAVQENRDDGCGYGAADALHERGLSPETAFRMANVALQILKSMHALYLDADPQERQALVTEYKRAVAAYLKSRLGS
jgi:hypothetical protein